MEKTTLRSLLLLMVITGSIFTFTACGPDGEVEVKTDETVKTDMKVEVKDETKVEVKDEVKAKVETKVDTTKTDGKSGMNVEAEIKANAEVKTDVPKVETTTPKVETNTQTEVKVTTKYNDGTYIKTGGYQSPGGNETVTVTVSVKADVVQSVSVASGTDNDISKKMQALFIDGVNAQVVGKKLVDVKVGVVNGSSLTGIGFNQAIDAIRSASQK